MLETSGEECPGALRVRIREVSAEDLQLNCGVRSVLSRHWIDLTKTSFYARRGHVHITGEASLLGKSQVDEQTAETLQAAEADLRRLREVKSIRFEFSNWARDETGFWHRLGDEPPTAPTGPQGGVGDAEVPEVDRASGGA